MTEIDDTAIKAIAAMHQGADDGINAVLAFFNPPDDPVSRCLTFASFVDVAVSRIFHEMGEDRALAVLSLATDQVRSYAMSARSPHLPGMA